MFRGLLSKLSPIEIGAIIFFIIELLFFSRYKIIIGSGMSMYPTIKDKTILLCEYTKEYKLNDIVYYRIAGKPIVHRIVQITEYKMSDNSIVKVYSIKGDNNNEPDVFSVYDENIICKIKFVK